MPYSKQKYPFPDPKKRIKGTGKDSGEIWKSYN